MHIVCERTIYLKQGTPSLHNWYFIRHKTVIGPKYENFLCGDLYVDSKSIGYKQIPITDIKNIVHKNDSGYIAYLSGDYDSFDNEEMISQMSAKDKQSYHQDRDKNTTLDTIQIDLSKLDKYIAKNKDLKLKHIGAFHNLIAYTNKRTKSSL